MRRDALLNSEPANNVRIDVSIYILTCINWIQRSNSRVKCATPPFKCTTSVNLRYPRRI